MEKEITIDLGRIFKSIFRKWWIVVMCATLSFGALYIVMPQPVSTYTATTSIYGAVYGSYVETMQSSNLLYSYGDVGRSKKVADRAASIINRADITGADIQAMTRIISSKESPIIYIKATSLDAETAKLVANAVVDSFIVEIQSSIGNNSVQVLDRAEKVAVNTGRGKIVFGAIGFLAGFFISIIVIAIKEIVSDKIYYVSDAELNGELDILGVIPEASHK